MMSSKVVAYQTLNVRTTSDVALVVLAVRRLSEQMKIDQVRSTRLATTASELATNIAKYASYGTITIKEGRTPLQAVGHDSCQR